MREESLTAQLVLHPAIADVIGPNYRLTDVAQALDRSVQGLRALARTGEFPRLFRVSRNDWRVEKEALSSWAATRWENSESVSRRVDAVRQAIRQPAWRRRRLSG